MEETLVSPYETHYGDWTYTQVYVFYQIWKANYGWIDKVPEDIHLLLLIPEKKKEYDSWLKEVWVNNSYAVRSLWVYNQLRLLKYRHLLGQTTSPIPKQKPKEISIPDYIDSIEKNSLGDIVSYRNKITGLVVDSSRELNMNAGRRFGKSFSSFTLVFGLSQWNFFHDEYSATIFLPTGDSVNRISTDINAFYKSKSFYNTLDSFSYFSSQNKFESQHGFRLELWTVNTNASTRGSTSLLNIIDEAGFMNDVGLLALENATQPTLKQYDAVQITTTSPAEDELNVILKDRCYDINNYLSFSLPTIANVSQNTKGDFVLSGTSIANDMKKVLKEQGNVAIPMFLGYPLSDTERTLYKPKHFLRYSRKELNIDNTEDMYLSIQQILQNSNVSKDEREKTLLNYNLIVEGGSPDNLAFSIITSDISFSGSGDSTVFLHIGFSKFNYNFYILDVYKKPLSYDNIAPTYASFLLNCLESPYGEKLSACYIESPRHGETSWYTTIKSHVTKRVADKKNLLMLHDEPAYQRLEKLASKVNLYLIQAHGGKLASDEKTTLMQKSIDINKAVEGMKVFSVSGSKSERAESAINTINRFVSPHSNETSKIIFFPKHNNNPDIDSVMEDCYKEALSFIRTGKNQKKLNQKDDFVDTLTYALLVYDLWNTVGVREVFNDTTKKPVPVKRNSIGQKPYSLIRPNKNMFKLSKSNAWKK